MTRNVRVDIVISDLDNQKILNPPSIWLASRYDGYLKQFIERGAGFHCPLIADSVYQREAPIYDMKRMCDVAGCGCFGQKHSARATLYGVVYSVRELGHKHFRLRGFCVSVCRQHEDVVYDLSSSNRVNMRCFRCDCDTFSCNSRLLNRTTAMCSDCKESIKNNGHVR